MELFNEISVNAQNTINRTTEGVNIIGNRICNTIDEDCKAELFELIMDKYSYEELNNILNR
jgi:hypothetical protein